MEVKDTLPAYVDAVEGPGTYNSANREITFNAGDFEVDEEKIRIQAKKDGSKSLRDSGIEKVILGLTSIEEVLSSTSDE